ncbi:5-methylcytosine rRNA methyltransferase NSUN4 isoform X2 [Aplysia californica]|nr:5-methylcytosine rRNA methyltransferase NSUN4 isoform X2 [Aplysia californica]XP_035826602.1 5-methylcytosine rRNA methyltransferase NSUN4 isoform X2 [Aplysia californica]XP_035826603.1 5-methylcytosine rRNA methyltransferase NSUN4 isoform X2 [Aplysia californica]XP_035826604.1 5-methylcytosine rRNA methyltransferase NSUN4 isoform X2 [Aplysia californica]
MHLKQNTGCQQALDHFDAFYKPFYGDKWPLIRVSLLSLSKHCAVINKFADPEKARLRLSNLGADDLVKSARRLQGQLEQEALTEQTLSHNSVETSSERIPELDLVANENSFNRSYSSLYNSSPRESLLEKSQQKVFCEDDRVDHGLQTGQEIDPIYDELYKDNIDVFVPTVQVLSERDQLLKDELNLNMFEPRNIDVQVQRPESINIARDIEAFAFPAGDVSQFPPAKSHNHRFGYYLMDAASVMPVIALNVQSEDQVLDLCAAPGGKTVLILQCLDLSAGGSLTCNDNSPSRVKRLKSVLRSYLPKDDLGQVEVMQLDGTMLNHCVYNKVLVDVPCNADRHVLTEEENNLFKPSRTRERLAVMEHQKKLLISAIRCCIVGGEIVYSTCTLAPAQNDGVIQAAMEELLETSQIEVAVEDLSPLASMFKDTFTFFEKSRYGQTIIPTLLNNFGPSFFAKLRRIK